MEVFLARPKAAIDRLLAANDAFKNRLSSAIPSHELPKSRLDTLRDASDQVPTCAAALSQSLFLIEQTGLDIADMETRMQNESRTLADVLERLGDAVRDQHFIKKHFENELVSLEEEAHGLAAALFPSGVQGLNKVNSKLWEFTNLQANVFRRTLDRIRGKLSEQQVRTAESRFAELRAPFDTLNEFLNHLATRALDGEAIEPRFEHVSGSLTEARDRCGAALQLPEFAEFRSILRSTIDIASALQEGMRSVRVPLFPAHNRLEELGPCIDEAEYANLTGLQTFALLNITSRMRSIKLAADSHMLSPAFGVNVFQVFPDRVYFRANASLLEAVRASQGFAPAPAGLHKFRAGSYKQNTFSTGNLQVSYSDVENGTINVDADIDLYRDPVRHLFGEVFRNHLTGKKTDAYKVRSVLDEHQVKPFGGFRIFGA